MIAALRVGLGPTRLWGEWCGEEIGKGAKAETLRAYLSGAEGVRTRFYSNEFFSKLY